MNTQELRKLAKGQVGDPKARIILELLDKIDQLQADAARMDWIQRHLFGHKWNGVVGPGGQTRWDVMTGYRHITAKMTGDTFRDAIDAAMKEQP